MVSNHLDRLSKSPSDHRRVIFSQLSVLFARNLLFICVKFAIDVGNQMACCYPHGVYFAFLKPTTELEELRLDRFIAKLVRDSR